LRWNSAPRPWLENQASLWRRKAEELALLRAIPVPKTYLRIESPYLRELKEYFRLLSSQWKAQPPQNRKIDKIMTIFRRENVKNGNERPGK
jgi:hypothetical protein